MNIDWQWVVISLLAVRSIVQQVYIRRLKLAIQNMTEAMRRMGGLKNGDVLRGGDKVEL
jgi:hypothetical protein